MENDTIYVSLDDSKRKLVVAIRRFGAAEPEEQEIPKDAQHIQRLFRRLRRATQRAAREALRKAE